MEDEIAVADAHPLGATPLRRDGYLHKFKTLADQVISQQEQDRFIQAASTAEGLLPGELHQLNVALPKGSLQQGRPGIF
jgi:2-methylcitrate dehydratase